MTSRTSEYAFRVLLVIGAMASALCLVEFPALINLIDYEALESKGVWGSLSFKRVPDPQLTHLEPPHAHYSGSVYGGDAEEIYQIPQSDRTLYRWDLKYDRNGFRNAADFASADTVVIGDSMVEGMTVSDSEVVTSVLQRMSGKTVVNLGQYGYGPQQEMIVLKRFGLPLQPHTVVWMFFEGNDLLDAIGYREIAAHPPTAWNFFLQRSFSRMAFRAVERMAGAPKPPGIARSGVLHAPHSEISPRIYFSYPAGPLSKGERDALDETLAIVAEADQLTAARQGRLLFVFVPDKFRVYGSFCQFPPESDCSRWTLSDLPDRLRKAVGSMSPEVGYLDLTPSLVNEVGKGRLPYYFDDIHWSPVGHRTAAEAITQYLSAWEKTGIAASKN